MEMDIDKNPEENPDESSTEAENGENSNPGSTEVSESGTTSGTTQYSDSWLDFTCVYCNEVAKSISRPKLLPCLHTACEACLESQSNSDSTTGVKRLSCSTCGQEINNNDIVDHLFLVEYAQSSESLPEECSYPCTSCEENSEGTAFCQDCQEWLCETCVNAHHRVRVTKDHVVRPKEEMEGETIALRNQKYLLCPIHSHEQLKLYCESCDKLTCRDCQLTDHKAHKYQFLTKACEEEKGNITELLTKIKEKQGSLGDATSSLNKRNEEILERERIVTQEIKTFAVKFITEINKRGKALLQDLNKVCTEKKNLLNFKNDELKSHAEKLKHCQKFAEAAIALGSETALVYSKKPIMNQLRSVLKHRCDVPNPNHMVDIQFTYESNFLTQYISSLGQILVDQLPIPGSSSNQNAMLPMPQTISQSPVPNAVVRQVPQMQVNQQRQVVNMQQMNQPQMVQYGQPQVTSSTDMNRNVNNAQQMRQIMNNKAVTYTRTPVQQRPPGQPNQQTNYALQANANYARHVSHQSAPQAPVRQHQVVQQQIPQPQPVQQTPPTYNNTVQQLPVPLRQNKNLSVTAVPSGGPSSSGPSPNKQRAIAPRSSLTMNPVNNQVQRINNNQASPQQNRSAPQLIVLDEQPNQKTPTMSNTNRLSHFPIPASITSNPSLQIQPANFNNNSRQGRRS